MESNPILAIIREYESGDNNKPAARSESCKYLHNALTKSHEIKIEMYIIF